MDAPAATASRPTRRRMPVVLIVAALVLGVDQATKFWADAALAGRAPVSLIGNFLELRLLRNSGAAFSIGSGSTWIFTIFAAVAVMVLLRMAAQAQPVGRAVALGLLLGGAGSHLLDRLFRAPGFGRGQVVDFIDYNGWFVGNVADIALTVGVAIFVVLSFTGGSRTPAA